MPESDFIGAQISSEGVPDPSERLGDIGIVAGVLLSVAVLFIVSMTIERLPIFIGFAAFVVALGILYQRAPSVGGRISKAFQRHRRSAIIFLIVLLAAYPVVLSHNPYLISDWSDCRDLCRHGARPQHHARLCRTARHRFCRLLRRRCVYQRAVCHPFRNELLVWPPPRRPECVFLWVSGGVAGTACFRPLPWSCYAGYGLMMVLLARNAYFLTNGTDGVINIPPPSIGSHSFIQPLALGWIRCRFRRISIISR